MIYKILPADKGKYVVLSHNDVLVTGKTIQRETVNVIDITSKDDHNNVGETLEEIKHLMETATPFERIVF